MPAPRLSRFLILLAVAFTGLLHAENFRTVVLDPGHGGKDDGAHWHGQGEKELTLDVAKRIEVLLRRNGIPTVLTRRTDKYVGLEERSKIANRYKNSIFISIHFNAHTNTSVAGIETFYYSPAGKLLAQKIQKPLAHQTASRDRGVKKVPYKVLLMTKSTAVLVEAGFLSNRVEGAMIKTSAHRQRIAEAIAGAIIAARK